MTPKGARAKGDKAEREVQALIRDHLGIEAPRVRVDSSGDVGDIRMPDTVVQVKNYHDVGRALTEGVRGAVLQQNEARTRYGCAFIRHPGGRFTVAMTPEQFFALWREAMA